MNEITVFTFDEVIDAPLEFVFMCLNKDEHVLQWNEYVVRNIYSTGTEEDLQAGSTYQTVQKVGKKEYTFEAEIIEHEPPFKASLKAVTKEGVSFTRYTLTEDENNGTRLQVEASLIPSNLKYKLATKLTGWAVQFVYKEQYKAFIDYIKEHKDYAWELVYSSEDGEYFTVGKAVLQKDTRWKIYLDNGDSDSYTMLEDKGYKLGHYGVYLFNAESLDKAQDEFSRWADSVWKPMLAKAFMEVEPE